MLIQLKCPIITTGVQNPINGTVCLAPLCVSCILPSLLVLLRDFIFLFAQCDIDPEFNFSIMHVQLLDLFLVQNPYFPRFICLDLSIWLFLHFFLLLYYFLFPVYYFSSFTQVSAFLFVKSFHIPCKIMIKSRQSQNVSVQANEKLCSVVMTRY